MDGALNDIGSFFNYKLKEGWSDLKLGRVIFAKTKKLKLLQAMA